MTFFEYLMSNWSLIRDEDRMNGPLTKLDTNQARNVFDLATSQVAIGGVGFAARWGNEFGQSFSFVEAFNGLNH